MKCRMKCRTAGQHTFVIVAIYLMRILNLNDAKFLSKQVNWISDQLFIAIDRIYYVLNTMIMGNKNENIETLFVLIFSKNAKSLTVI